MNLSAAIQTHPLRRDLAGELAAAIGGPVTLAQDPEPEARHRSPWRTYRHALELTPHDATHRLVIQDDAIVCRDFRTTVERAVAARPERLIVLFVAGSPREHARAIMDACSKDEPWAELDNARWCPAVACVWPVALIGELLTFVDAQGWPAQFGADDEILGRYLRHAKRRPLATVPSLVEHPDDVPSLLGRRAAGGQDTGRIAKCMIHPDCDPLAIDWA